MIESGIYAFAKFQSDFVFGKCTPCLKSFSLDSLVDFSDFFDGHYCMIGGSVSVRVNV